MRRRRSRIRRADVIAWAHNETSTGVMVPVARPDGAGDALVLVDATSGAGGLPLDASQADVYYFAPQKAFGADGGLWLAAAQPGRDRADRAARRRRRTAGSPPSSRCRRRWRTRARSRPTTRPRSPPCSCSPTRSSGCWPAAASTGAWSAPRPRRAISTAGPSGAEFATPFVADPAKRSLVVGTIDFDDSVDAAAIAATLRANGIVDVEPYRKLGRNQLRIGMFPAVEPADVEALTACIDWVVENVGEVRP